MSLNFNNTIFLAEWKHISCTYHNNNDNYNNWNNNYFFIPITALGTILYINTLLWEQLHNDDDDACFTAKEAEAGTG